MKLRSIGGLVALGLAAAACNGNQGGSSPSAFDDAKAKLAKVETQRYASEAYPQWSVNHPGSACPASLDELREYLANDRGRDPWGHPYQMLCGAAAPAAAKGFGVVSYGADGKPGGTGADADVTSWE